MKIILSLLISMIGILSAYADTIPNFKFPNNHIQIGLTSINFMDGYGYKYSKIIENEISTSDFNISFSRNVCDNVSISFGFYRYTRNNYMQIKNQNHNTDMILGDIISRNFKVIELGVNKMFYKKIYKNYNLYFNPSLYFKYRYGSNTIFLNSHSRTGVQCRGFGVGTGAEVGIIAYKHFSLSASLDYNYIFERGKYEELSPPNLEYYKYTPPRNMLIFQPKIGFLF